MLTHGKCLDCKEPVDCVGVINSLGMASSYNSWIVCSLCFVRAKDVEHANYQGIDYSTETVVQAEGLRCSACVARSGRPPFSWAEYVKTKGFRQKPAFNFLDSFDPIRALAYYESGLGWQLESALSITKSSPSKPAFAEIIPREKLCFCNNCHRITGPLAPGEAA